MKRYKLKPWVKKTLLIMGVVGVLVLLAIILDNHYKRAVEQCVEGGNPRVFCENTLR